MSDKFEQYEHHGVMVWVNSELKGKHREHCLCYQCLNFNPGTPEDNCPIANANYALCVLENMVLPVWECPKFEEAPFPSKYLE
jgi:hypothetical protein